MLNSAPLGQNLTSALDKLFQSFRRYTPASTLCTDILLLLCVIRSSKIGCTSENYVRSTLSRSVSIILLHLRVARVISPSSSPSASFPIPQRNTTQQKSVESSPCTSVADSIQDSCASCRPKAPRVRSIMDQTWAAALGDRAPVLQSRQVAEEAGWVEWGEYAPPPAGLQGLDGGPFYIDEDGSAHYAGQYPLPPADHTAYDQEGYKGYQPYPTHANALDPALGGDLEDVLSHVDGNDDHHTMEGGSEDGSEYSPSAADNDGYGEGHSPSRRESETGNNSSPTVYRGIIQDATHYYIQRSARRNREEQKLLDQGVESDCPEDPAEQRVWIGKLFDAIKNIDGVIDKPCKNGTLAQSVQRIKDNYYSDEAIEIACWNIFLECRQAALGVEMVDPHHQTKREPKNAYPNFAARMEKVIQVCKTSKATCKQVLDPSFIHRLVDAPTKALKMKESNLKINTQRNIQNEIGRETIKKEGIVRPGLNPVKTPSKAKRGKARRARSPATPIGSGKGSTSLTPGMSKLKTSSNKRRAKDDEEGDEGDHEEDNGGSSDEYSPPKRRATRKRVQSTSTPSKGQRKRAQSTGTPSKGQSPI
ncbi:uncharacterized protein BP5553_04159 [Venustampulla echinocandica]|uniref:Uncharacterized protein n=1 Tax=Venustampulla echinocandica TaxID=2656787 RepID=A0A370TWC0_9HELO|nr:uncharacterized protein BP5553_04159 [Venustampulla echinocandica]RDL39819.1 hypothetical protein BP5553_04159 [Venustampulla echinocandica]